MQCYMEKTNKQAQCETAGALSQNERFDGI